MGLPDFVIIGAHKCGTTSLHYYLQFHPEIVTSDLKETNFFSIDEYWNKGIEWYQSHFRGGGRVCGEASPSYTMYPKYPLAPERLHSIAPEAKLIYLVRDPLERLLSHYLDVVKGGQETRSFGEVVESLTAEDTLVSFGCYAMQLERYLRYFPCDRILVLSAEDLKNNRRDILRRVFSFLGVDASFYTDEFNVLKNVNRTKMKRKKPRRWIRSLLGASETAPHKKSFLPASLRRLLGRVLLPKPETVRRPLCEGAMKEKVISFFKSDAARLRQLTGLALGQWCV